MKTILAIMLALALTIHADPAADARAIRDAKCNELRAQIAALESEMRKPRTLEHRALRLTRQQFINECNERVAVLKAELWKVSTTK